MIRKFLRYGHRPWRWQLRTRRWFIGLFFISIPAWIAVLVLRAVWACVYNLVVKPISYAWNTPPMGQNPENYGLQTESDDTLAGVANDCGASVRAA